MYCLSNIKWRTELFQSKIIRWIWCYFDGIFLKTKPTSNDAMLFVNCGDWKQGRNVFKKRQITVAVRFSICRHIGSMRLNFVVTQLASVCDLPAISKPLLFTNNKYFFNKSTSTLSECWTTLVLLTSVQSNTLITQTLITNAIAKAPKQLLSALKSHPQHWVFIIVWWLWLEAKARVLKRRDNVVLWDWRTKQ